MPATREESVRKVLRPGSEYPREFERLKELGRGRFGIVYQVRDGEGTIAAAKHIKCRKRDVKERALEEIHIVSQLECPHVTAFVSAFETPSELILVMEYLSGGELFERVAAEDFELTEAQGINFMAQICRGVNYIHEKNIVHLDLKPENVVCCRPDSDDIKIIDFGLARIINPGDQVKVMCGTAEFVSPEVVNYDPVSPASDVWSLGVIAYVLLSGLSPFMGDSVAETYSNVSRAEYDFDEPEFDPISSFAKDFISKALLRDPRRRMTAAAALRHEWLRPRPRTPSVVSPAGGTKAAADAFAAVVDTVLVTNKANLRRFLARRRWQRCGQAIRAMKRMSGLMHKRRSTQSLDGGGGGGNSSGGLGSDAESPSSPQLLHSPSVSVEDSSSSDPPTPVFQHKKAINEFPTQQTDKKAEDTGDASTEALQVEEEEGEETTPHAQFVFSRLHRSSITIEIGDKSFGIRK